MWWYSYHCFEFLSTTNLWLYILSSIDQTLIFYCCAWWGYIVAFIEVLTLYQIYHTWIHPLYHSPLSPTSNSWNSFNRYHFSIYVLVHIIFAYFNPSTPFPHFLPPSTGTECHWQNMFKWLAMTLPSSTYSPVVHFSIAARKTC
jgi:hypothetical protein